MTNQAAMVTRQPSAAMALAGTSHDAEDVTARLQAAVEKYNLVSPATSCGVLPEGCGIAISTVQLNPDPRSSSDVYAIPGSDKLGLSKSALDRIGAALGVSWDARQSRRTDDGSDPLYCVFQAVGTYRCFDGSEIQIMGTKEMDLREGSPQLQGVSPAQANGIKKFLMPHAETKARLRAIRSLGIRTGYTREELQKPFVCARLMFTGHTDDPELRRAFALKRADAMLGGSRALFGEPEPLPPAPLPLPPTPPPPVGNRARDDDQPGGPPQASSRTRNAPQTQQRQVEIVEQHQTARQDPPPDRSQGQRRPQGPAGRDHVVFGTHRGKKLIDISDELLDGYIGALQAYVEDPARADMKAQNTADLDAAVQEEQRRIGGDAGGADAFADDREAPQKRY